jgi:hypothetical protein
VLLPTWVQAGTVAIEAVENGLVRLYKARFSHLAASIS